MISFKAKVVFSATPSGTSVRIIRICAMDGDSLPLHSPGQYALLTFPNCMARPYSLANAADGKILEFHIREGHSGASHYATHHLKIDDVIEVKGFGGSCLYQDNCARPIVLVAGGTGLSPMMAIAEAALKDNPYRRVSLFHGGRIFPDLYAQEDLMKLQQECAAFTYHPVLSEEKRTSIKTGLVGDVALKTVTDIQGTRFYCAGSVEMQRHFIDLALSHGVQADLIHSDYDEFETASQNEAD